MLLIKLWNYLRGYVIIKISGEYTERLLNQAVLKGILLWDVRRIDDENLIAKIGIEGFFGLSRLTKRTRCRIKILRRSGLSFLLKRLSRRKVLMVGGLFFVFAMYFFSSLIWSVEILTSDPEIEAAIEDDLKLYGVRRGAMKRNVDKQLLQDEILTNYDEVAWVQIYFKGSKAVVELVEKKLPPDFEDTCACDIIAIKDGIVEEIIPFNGEALVKVGDTVSAGDILISGKNRIQKGQDEKGNPLFYLEPISAHGIVKARVWYQRAVKIPLTKTENTITGIYRRGISLQLGSKTLNIPWGTPPFQKYKTDIVYKFQFPFGHLDVFDLNVYRNWEVRTSEKTLSVKEASSEAETHLLLGLQAFNGENITQRKIEYILDEKEKAVVGSITWEVIEDIGQKRPFSE